MAGNARSGRPRKPREMKVVQGTFRKDRHGAEVHVASAWPAPPAHLNARERLLWSELEQHCKAWVAPSDWITINGVVSLVDRLLNIQAALAASDVGTPELLGMELRTWRELRAFIGLMGLSPVDRSRMVVTTPATPAGALSRFLKPSTSTPSKTEASAHGK